MILRPEVGKNILSIKAKEEPINEGLYRFDYVKMENFKYSHQKNPQQTKLKNNTQGWMVWCKEHEFWESDTAKSDLSANSFTHWLCVLEQDAL